MEYSGTLPLAAPARPRRWTPSLFDLIVVALPVWFFGLSGDVASALLSDSDTGWHIRTGDWMLEHGQFVREDLFSFTKPGAPWFAWEWLTDVIFSILHRTAGLQGLILFTISLSALFLGVTLRHMVRRGANVFIAFPLALLGFGAASVHLLARPHLWTMAFVAITAYVMHQDVEKPSWRVWLLVPLTVLWTNLHGGWLAGVVLLALASIGAALETLAGRNTWTAVKRYALLAAACLGASLLNPYGFSLHAHLVSYLSAGWIKDLVAEFKSPSFRTENMMLFEFLLLASVAACATALKRRQFIGPLTVLFWAHSSLESARHIPLFIAVAMPFLASELARLWPAWTGSAKRNSVPAIFEGMAADLQPAIARVTFWVAVPFVLAALPLSPLKPPQDLPADTFPAAMAAQHPEVLMRSRLFTTEQWAGYLIYRNYPNQRVFTDGRSDFYGERISRDYCLINNLDPSWRKLIRQYEFDAFLVRPDTALASALRQTPEWRVAGEDKQAVLFLKVAPTG